MGDGGEHVLDAITQAEQYGRAHNLNEASVRWKLLFRKEVFTPWYNPMTDLKGIVLQASNCKPKNDMSIVQVTTLYRILKI